MSMFRSLCFVLIWHSLSAFGPKCKITIEEVTVDYVNEKYMTANAVVHGHNSTRTNVVDMTSLFKIDLPENTRISFTTLKLARNGYKIPVLRIEKSFKSLLEMEAFGIQTYCMEHSRPPFVWPIKKNVLYKFTGISIDCSSYPPNLPDGKWLDVGVLSFANKTKLGEMTFRMLMEYV